MEVSITQRIAMKNFMTDTMRLIREGDTILTAPCPNPLPEMLTYRMFNQLRNHSLCWNKEGIYIGKLETNIIIKSKNFLTPVCR
jgi:hypothetical protein